MKNKLSEIGRCLWLVFHRPAYIILAVIVAVSFFFINLGLSHYLILAYIFKAGTFDWPSKIQLLFNLVKSIGNSFTLSSVIWPIILSVLAGLNLTLLIFYLKKQIALMGAAGISAFGMFSGLLGVGCFSCGSIILSSIFGLTVSSILINFLPLKGLELKILGLMALLFSSGLIIKKMNSLASCAKI